MNIIYEKFIIYVEIFIEKMKILIFLYRKHVYSFYINLNL